MKRTRWLAMAATGVAVVVGGGVALAAGGSTGPSSEGRFPKPRLAVPGHFPGADLIGTAAKYLGMTRAQVLEGVHDGKSLADLAEAKGESVDGLKQALRDAITEHVDETVDDLVERSGPPGLGFALPVPRFGPPGLPGPHKLPLLPGIFPGADLLETAADYLGMDVAEIRRALARGKSPADLAKEKGKSVDGLEDALSDAVRKDADKAVEDGALTRKQADELVERFGKAIGELVDGGLKRGFGFRFHGGDRDGDFEFHLRVRPGDRVPVPD